MISFADIERLFAKVSISPRDDGCWEWMGCRSKGGYGRFGYNKGEDYAHRIAYAVFYLGGNLETLPPHVCHTCDNQGCCNPHHLFAGDSKSNLLDAVAKERCSRKLSRADVRQVRGMIDAGMNRTAIAEHFSVNVSTIRHIEIGKSWTVESESVTPTVQLRMRRLPNKNGKKISEDQVREVRRRLAAGESHSSIAKDYGVTRSNISAINTGASWVDVS